MPAYRPAPGVSDPGCQLNWDWQSRRDEFPQILSVGPAILGPAAIPATATAVPGIAIVYVTPEFPVVVEISGHIRIDATAAAWAYAYTSLGISPTPRSKLHANASPGSAFNAAFAHDLMWVHNAGVASCLLKLDDFAVLEARTQYTIQAYVGSGTGNVNVGGGIAENMMKAKVWPL